MVSESFINILASGITAGIAIIIGALLFKAVKGGIKIPAIFGNMYVNKLVAIGAFIISIYFIGWLSQHLEVTIKNFLIKNQTNVIAGVALPILVFYFLFNYLFYNR